MGEDKKTLSNSFLNSELEFIASWVMFSLLYFFNLVAKKWFPLPVLLKHFKKWTTCALFSIRLPLATWFATKVLTWKGLSAGSRNAALGEGVWGVGCRVRPSEDGGAGWSVLGQRTSKLLLAPRLWEEKSMFNDDFKQVMFI